MAIIHNKIALFAFLAAALAPSTTLAQTPQTYNGFVTQEDTSDIINLGLDQKTLENLINDNKDGTPQAAEQGFADGLALYNGSTPGQSSLTFQGLAQDAAFFNDSSGSRFESFDKYVSYYGGNAQYMDVSTRAGLVGGDADFSSGGGPNFQYSLYNPRGRADVIEKATNYLIVAMYIQGHLEKAVDSCRQGQIAESNDNLDRAVAYYVGSESLNGPFFFNLAVARCGNFGTCDANGNAPVNEVVFEEFSNMKQSLSAENGQACTNTEASKNEILEKMVVPLIQGVIRYAVFLGLDGDTDDKSEAEGAIFAQAVLPYIADCDASAAQIIFDNMKPVSGDSSVNFNAVVSAFESTYACLDIDAADIGCYDGRVDAGCTPGSSGGSSGGGGGSSGGSTGGGESSAYGVETSFFAMTAAAVASVIAMMV